MICQHCKQKEATTQVWQTVNGKTSAYVLCPECAAQLGYHNMFGSIGIHDLLSNLLGEGTIPARQEESVKCPKCGMTMEEIVETGRVGCSGCYETFYDRLLPSLQRIHGKVGHVGKIPSTASEAAKRKKQRIQLEQQLQKAVELQNFEEAAGLRDQLRAMEEETPNE